MSEIQRWVRVGELPVYNFLPEYPLARGVANQFTLPLGRDPGVGQFLMLREDLEKLKLRESVSVDWVCGDVKFAFPRMFIHSAQRVHWGGVADDPKAMYMVKLVDARHLLQWTSTSRAFNVRSFAGGGAAGSIERKYLAETLRGGSRWDAGQIVEQLWSDCKFLGPFRNNAATVGLAASIPEDLFFHGCSAWDALNTFLEKNGRTISYNPIKDRFSVVKDENTLSPEDRDVGKHSLLFDSRPLSGRSCVAPEVIRVFFHVRYEDYGTEFDTERSANYLTSGSTFYIDIRTGTPGAVSGTVLPLWASTPAVVAHKSYGSFDNLSGLRFEAQQLADAWLRANQADRLSRARVVLSGWIRDWLPDGNIKVVRWLDHGDGAVTEVSKFPKLPPAGVGGGEDENYRGHDFARKTAPNYPRLPNLVEVADPKKKRGEPTMPNKSGVFPGVVRRVVAGGMAQLENCWILFVDEYAAKAGKVQAQNGEIYGPGRLSGLHTFEKLTLPLYVVRKGSGDGESLVQFRLKSDLSPGGSADAVLINRNAGGDFVEGAKVVVHDWFSTGPGMWQAPWQLAGVKAADYVIEGFAVARNRHNYQGLAEYDIVWMETLAWTIEFELLEDLMDNPAAAAGGGVKARVLAAYEQGKRPIVGKDGEVEYVRVYDDNQAFSYALTGCKGTAIRSEHDGTIYYKIVHVEQMCYLARCEAYANAFGTAVQIAAGSFSVASIDPHSYAPNPEPETIQNPRGHNVRAGDTFLAVFNAGTNQWEVLDVLLFQSNVVMGSRVNGLCLQNLVASNVPLEYYNGPAWENWHCGTDCDGAGGTGG